MSAYRTAAAAGLAFFLLAFAELLGPSFPLTSDSPSSIDSHFRDHRSWGLIAVMIQGCGNVLWVVFLCGLVALAIRSGALGAGLVVAAGGLLNVAISLAGLAGVAALAYGVAGHGNPQVTADVFTLSAMTLVLSNFMLALMAAGVACAPLPRWFRVASCAVAVVFLAGGFAFAQDGAFSPDGAVQFATYGLELLWTVAASIVLLVHGGHDVSALDRRRHPRAVVPHLASAHSSQAGSRLAIFAAVGRRVEEYLGRPG